MAIEKFELKDGRFVEIKRLTIDDYQKENNYEFVHEWLHKVNKYLNLEFNKEDLEHDKSNFYDFMAQKEGIVIGALFDQKIIGTADLRFNFESKKQKHVGSWGIAIHPAFQNQGLGTRLLLIIEKIAKERGLKRLEADFYEGNKSAEQLYINKLKYIIEGRQKFAILLNDGTYTDKILIGKIIDKSLNGKVK